MSICLPGTQSLLLFSLAPGEDNMLKATLLTELPAISATSIRATRENVWDLLVVKPDHQLVILTHGLRELRIEVGPNISRVDRLISRHPEHGKVVSVQNGAFSSTTLLFEDGWKSRTAIDLVPQDPLTKQCLEILATTLPSESSFALHHAFLKQWSSHGLATSNGVEFESFTRALYNEFGLDQPVKPLVASTKSHPWARLGGSASHFRFQEDPVLKELSLPLPPSLSQSSRRPPKAHKLLAPILYALHTLGEDLRLMVHRYESVLRLAPVIRHIALVIRPEWADYWTRLCPDATAIWPSPETAGVFCTDLSRYCATNPGYSHRTS